MQLKMDNYSENYGAELLCPCCGGNYLHHAKVEVFERDEDASVGTHATFANGAAKLDGDISGNPSRRRGGIAIHFTCEQCPAEPVLYISQHKGCTLLDFI